MLLITPLQSEVSELTPAVFHSYSIEEARHHLRIVCEEVPFARGRIPDQLLEGNLDATQKRTCIR